MNIFKSLALVLIAMLITVSTSVAQDAGTSGSTTSGCGYIAYDEIPLLAQNSGTSGSTTSGSSSGWGYSTSEDVQLLTQNQGTSGSTTSGCGYKLNKKQKELKKKILKKQKWFVGSHKLS